MSNNKDPLFLAGRYNKYNRTVSQTPWFIDGSKKVADSVEDFIKDAINLYIPHKKSRFSASGREDVDVRMLGRGRPFVLEIIDPPNDIPLMLDKCQEQVKVLSKGKVTVRDLQVVSRQEVNQFQKEDDDKKKQYTALCIANRPLSTREMDTFNSSFKSTQIEQRTPIRVLHRRPLATRLRTIQSLELRPYDPDDQNLSHKFLIEVVTEAGAYIKELVHGDLGRTTPCLSDMISQLLGQELKTDIISLDVQQVFVEWPPSLDDPIDNARQ